MVCAYPTLMPTHQQFLRSLVEIPNTHWKQGEHNRKTQDNDPSTGQTQTSLSEIRRANHWAQRPLKCMTDLRAINRNSFQY